jgi:hypothetical protein
MKLEDFGRQLIETMDLDPVYVMLHRAELPEEQLHRWLISYWCCYHSGVSSFLSEQEGDNFWFYLRQMAANLPSPLGGRWPRGTERRHWRGEKAVISARYLHARFYPCSLVPTLQSLAPSFHAIRNEVTSWPEWGPWISFKVADMLDRVLQTPVTFPVRDVFYKEPLAAAELWSGKKGQDAILPTLEHLDTTLGHFEAPPSFDRLVSLPEFETILCKWKSSLNGHYPIGKDTEETLHAVREWSKVSKTADRMVAIVEEMGA